MLITLHPKQKNKQASMIKQELKEIFQLLEAQGLRPELYDTHVP